MQADPPTATVFIADVIGPTVLAEGVAAGRRCSLIRLGGCNLTCSWCDAASTWDANRYDLSARLAHRPAAQVAEAALSCSPGLVVVTGGEPMLQQQSPGWPVLLDAIGAVEVGLETNGTVAPTDETLRRISWVTVSPKLAHAGDPNWERINSDVLIQWGALAMNSPIDFFFVVRDRTDIDTISTLVTIHALPPHRVWVSPEGTTTVAVATRLHDVADAAVLAGFNVAPRIVNPFGGAAAGQRVAAAFAAAPGASASVAPAPVPENRAPVGARFRRS